MAISADDFLGTWSDNLANVEAGPVLPGQGRKVWPRDGSAPGKGGFASHMGGLPYEIAGGFLGKDVDETGNFTGYNAKQDINTLPDAPGYDPNVPFDHYSQPYWQGFGIVKDASGREAQLRGTSPIRGYTQFKPGGAPAIPGYDYDASKALADQMAAEGYTNYMIDRSTGEYYPRGRMPLQHQNIEHHVSDWSKYP